ANDNGNGEVGGSLARQVWTLLGDGSLLSACGDVLLAEGHQIAAVLTIDPWNRAGAEDKGIRVERSDANLAATLATLDFDHLVSIAHLSIVPAEAPNRVRGV